MACALGWLRIAATARGICRISLQGEPVQDVNLAPAANGLVAEAAAQLRAYLAGARTVFDLPLDLQGTPFQQSVWRRW